MLQVSPWSEDLGRPHSVPASGDCPLPQRTVRIVNFNPAALDVDQLEAAVRGELCLVLNENELDRWLSPPPLAAYERAKTDHFVVRYADEALKDAWLFWCKATREPFVIVTIEGRFSTVRLDMFPTGRALTRSAVNAIAAVLLAETGHVEFLDGTYVGPDICESRWVPLACARSVASAMSCIARGGVDRDPNRGA
jgi:hypothetical protein